MRKIKDEFILTKDKIKNSMTNEKKCYLPIKNCEIVKEEVIRGVVEFSNIFMLVNKDDPEKVFVDVDENLPMIFTANGIAHMYKLETYDSETCESPYEVQFFDHKRFENGVVRCYSEKYDKSKTI